MMNNLAGRRYNSTSSIGNHYLIYHYKAMIGFGILHGTECRKPDNRLLVMS